MSSTIQPQDLIFVIGSPGAGKGPICQELARRWNWMEVSVGDEVRRYCRDPLVKDDVVTQCMRDSELIPVEKLAEILNYHIRACKDQGWDSFIIDGFPRDVNQISYIHEKVGVPGRVLLLECDKAVAKQSVLGRVISGRADTDTEEIFEKRFKEFESKNPAIVAHYEAEDKLMKIDANVFMDSDGSMHTILDATEALLDAPGLTPKLRLRDLPKK